MERRSRESAVALATHLEEGSALLGGAIPFFATLQSQAERTLAERLAGELAEGPEGARLRAAARLVDIAGELAVPLLSGALPNAEPALRVALADALGRAGGPEAIRAVERLRGDPDPLVRAAAVDAAARLLADDPASLAGALREALADADPKVRRRAALQAASARGIDPGELLAPVLSDDDRHARRLAAVALGATRRPGAALALLDALLDDDDSVRDAAAGSAVLLLGADAARIAGLSPLQRGRAIARLKAHVAANPAMLADPASVSDAPTIAAAAATAPEAAAPEAPAADREPSPLPYFDGEPAARMDHELDEDVLAVMQALTRARSVGESSGEAASSVEDDRTVSAVAGEPVDAAADDLAVAVPGSDVVAHADARDADSTDAAADDLAVDAVDETGADLAAPAGAPDAEEAAGDFMEIEKVVRSALRGVTPDDLAQELGLSPLALGPVLDDHLEAGRLVRRGKKLFLP